MPVLSTKGQLTNGQRCDIFKHSRITEINNTENNDLQNAPVINSDSESETHMLTQEAINEQIKNYVALLTEQLQDLTQVMEGITQALLVNFPATIYQQTSLNGFMGKTCSLF